MINEIPQSYTEVIVNRVDHNLDRACDSAEEDARNKFGDRSIHDELNIQFLECSTHIDMTGKVVQYKFAAWVSKIEWEHEQADQAADDEERLGRHDAAQTPERVTETSEATSE